MRAHHTTKAEWQELQTLADAWHLNPNNISHTVLKKLSFSWLSPDERAQYEKFQTAESRHGYLAARALCRATLSRYTGVEPSDWSFGTSVHGKPKIVAPAEFRSLRFNMTHASGLVVCLVSRVGEVGVDAEETSRTIDVAQVARHFLSGREQARLQSLPARQRVAGFFEQWVLREAYLKGKGLGIALAPERFTIRFDKNGRPLPIGNWQLSVHRPTAKHIAGVAVRRPRDAAPISVRWLKADDLSSSCLTKPRA